MQLTFWCRLHSAGHRHIVQSNQINKRPQKYNGNGNGNGNGNSTAKAKEARTNR